MLVNELVNKAIYEAVDAAVFVDLVGELGPHIDKADASAQMPVDEAINKAAESARMLADEAIDKAVTQLCSSSRGGSCSHSLARPLQAPECRLTRPSTGPFTQLCSLILWGLTRPSMRPLRVPE